MRESEHTVLANRFTANENWSHANSEWNRVKARARDLPAVILSLLAFCALPSANRAQVPVYEVTPVESTIKFDVGSSVPIKGTFDKWNASMKFSSTDVRSGVLDIEIQADSVNTGNGLKNNKLKGKDFFNAKDSHHHVQIHENRSDRSKHIRPGRRLYDSRSHENRKAHSCR